MLGLTFSSKLDWDSYIFSIAKTASKKIGAVIRSMKFLSPEIALHLFKSTIRPCMEYCCYVWAGAPSCYLELLDKLQKRICRAVGPSLATSLEPLAHHQNVASLSLFYRYYFAKCSSELAQLVPLPYSRGSSTRYPDRLHGFPVTIPSCYNDVSVNSSFPCTATTIFMIFMTLMFYQIFFSPQVKQSMIISYKHGIYKLPHKLLNDLRFQEISKQQESI